MHRWTIKRRLSVVVSKQVSLRNVHVYHGKQGDGEHKRQCKSVGEAHKYRIEYECIPGVEFCVWPGMDVNELWNCLCFSLIDFFRIPGIFNSSEFGARNDANNCAVRHKCLNKHSISDLGSNLHIPFVGEVCMISLERNEAQRAVFEVSIREKTNDACVDKLRDEKELAELVVGFTYGLETNLMNN